MDCLKYLHETAKAPWNSQAVRRAHENIPPECVQYLLDNDCPLPDGWSYEDGELYSSEEEEGDYADWEEVVVDIDFGSLRGSINRCGRAGWDESSFCHKLLKRINSSCSSGRERRKSVSGMMDD